MADPMQTAVEVLARELSCDTEEEWADRVNWPEAAAGAETFRVEARRILAKIEPLIRAEEREACAKVVEAEAHEECDVAEQIAAAIRQRGNE